MRLIKASASGYKRLAHNCELNLDTDPVCIVGPNAAGKSSFLDALVHLNDDRAFTVTEGTRVPGGDRMEPSIEARFELDEEDREELDDIPEARQVSQLLVYKDEADGLYYRADPFPERDLSKRRTVQVALEQLQEVDWPAKAQAVEAAQAAPPDPLFDALFISALTLAEDDDQEIESQVPAFDALGGRIGAVLGQIEAREQAAEEGEEYEGPTWP
jgi:ATPase subunit of ABC transporter with duplicated ATPase domains